MEAGNLFEEVEVQSIRLFVGIGAKTGIWIQHQSPCSLSCISLLAPVTEAPGGWPLTQVLRDSRRGWGVTPVPSLCPHLR